MERIRREKKDMKLRNSFVLYVLVTFLLVVSLSGAVIVGCVTIRKWLLPESDEIFLNVEQTNEDGSSSMSQIRMKMGDETNTEPLLFGSPQDTSIPVNAKYSVTSIDNSFSTLSPKRQLLYQGCTIAMIALPVLLSLAGILFCGFFFYKKS